MPDSDLLSQPLAGAEFLALDTETNGLPRDRCELTEVGAVLVGGGELHDRWDSLVGVSAPLGRGIQRFTGITQAMVDVAPPPEQVLPELSRRLRGRLLVAHNAQFDVRVLRQAFDRAALTWPDPPVICTVALARRFAPLQRRRGLASLADALGIDVGAVHRALPDAETCARVLCALLPRLCAAAETVGDALAVLKPRRPGRRRIPGAVRPRDQRPDLSKLPKDPGVYIFRDADGRPLYVGKSVCLRTRARAHFTQPVAWTGQAEHVDYQPTESELGALVLENRLIKRLLPPGNVNLKKQADGYVYLRCRLDIPYPILEVAREPAAGHAVCVGPGARAGGGGRAGRAAQLAVRAAPLRAGDAEAAVAVGLRADGALPVAVPRRPGSEPLPRAARRGAAAVRGRARRRQRAARARGRQDPRRLGRAGVRARRVAPAPPQAAGLAARAPRRRAARRPRRRPARARPAPDRRRRARTRSGSSAAAWSIGVPARAARDELLGRTRAALSATPGAGLGGWLPADELDEARIVGAWLAGHDEARVTGARPRAASRPHRALRRRHRPAAQPRGVIQRATCRFRGRPRRGGRGARAVRSRAPAAGRCGGSGRMSIATTCVTGAPVWRARRAGRSERIHFELWPGSVDTMISSWWRGSQNSATASNGLASPHTPSARMPASRHAASASSSRGRAASRPLSPGPWPGTSSVTSIGLRSARALIASIRSLRGGGDVGDDEDVRGHWGSSGNGGS